jgi:CRP/FNR family cyclic AMP-dependent transcriptional regulator
MVAAEMLAKGNGMEHILTACEGLPVVRLAPGDVLMTEGERRKTLYVLAEGVLGVYRGGVQVSRVATAGALFGEMSQLLDMPYSASVKAETEAAVFRVEDGSAFLKTSPDIALHTARLLAQRLYDATTYLADLKRQFEGDNGHFGMVDRILGSLMNQQQRQAVRGTRASNGAAESDDPRL